MSPYGTEQVKLLRETIAKGLNEGELQFFLQVCLRTGLDPFARQICPVMRWNEKAGKNTMSIQVQVDGLRLLAQRTGEYGGSDKALYDEGLTLYQHIQAKRGLPTTCSVTVYRIVQGHRVPYTHEVAWKEFYPGDKLGFMWKSKPYQMMAKVCESQAIRKGFQLEVAGLQAEEEIPPAHRPATGQVERSAEWHQFCRDLRQAETPAIVHQLAAAAGDRFPNQYLINRERQIALERFNGSPQPLPSQQQAEPIAQKPTPQRLRSSLDQVPESGSLPKVPDSGTPKTETPARSPKDLFSDCCKILGLRASETYKTTAPLVGLTKEGKDMTAADCALIVAEAAAQWAYLNGIFGKITPARQAYHLILDANPGEALEKIVESWKSHCEELRRSEMQGKLPTGEWEVVEGDL